MDTTIRNLDAKAYRALKSRAALTGRTVGELMNEAMRAYLTRPDHGKKRRSLRELRPQPFPDGNERLSEEIDRIAYGL